MGLHRLIRLMTCAYAGEGFLSQYPPCSPYSLQSSDFLNSVLAFMGNEFGHPEVCHFLLCPLTYSRSVSNLATFYQWLELPSVGNGFQSTRAGRQWHLEDPAEALRYASLAAFDRDLMRAEGIGGWNSDTYVSLPLARTS